MIIGITGGKGGTGKTVFAVNLAVALAKQGKNTAYLDCDVDCPSSSLITGAKLDNKQEVHSFLPRFIEEKCNKCGKCVATCKFNALYQLKDQSPSLMGSLCIGCGACMIACPFGAIEESSKVIGFTYATKKYDIDFYSGELKPSELLTEMVVGAVKRRGLEKNYDVVIVDTAAGAHFRLFVP